MLLIMKNALSIGFYMNKLDVQLQIVYKLHIDINYLNLEQTSAGNLASFYGTNLFAHLLLS